MTSCELVDKAVERLRSASAAIRCQELAAMLTSLGFDVRDGKNPGHKVFVHHGIASFSSSGYTCGHGKNPEIKPVYVKKVARLIKQYETELIAYLGEKK